MYVSETLIVYDLRVSNINDFVPNIDVQPLL